MTKIYEVRAVARDDGELHAWGARPSREEAEQVLAERTAGKGRHVEIVDLEGRTVASYERNYPQLFRTFEPFRQGDRLMALISPDYTATSVIDLATGQVLAGEEPHSLGFCPTGF